MALVPALEDEVILEDAGILSTTQVLNLRRVLQKVNKHSVVKLRQKSNICESQRSYIHCMQGQPIQPVQLIVR